MGSDIMIEEKVREMLNQKQWTLAELQDMKGLVSIFSDEIYGELDAKEKLDMVWEEPINNVEQANFGRLFYYMVIGKISEEVAIVLKKLLMNANVNFNGGNKNEVSEGSMGGQSLEERPSNEKTDSEE